MPLLASRMATAMKTAIDLIDRTGGAIDNQLIMTAVCKAIVDEIQTNFVEADFNPHTHAFVYTGAGQGATEQDGDTEAAVPPDPEP